MYIHQGDTVFLVKLLSIKYFNARINIILLNTKQ